MYAAVYPVIPADINLPFQLAGIGKCGNQCSISRHSGFSLYMIFYTRGGSGKIIYNGVQSVLRKGDVIILSKDIPYEYEPLEDNWKTSWITFRGANIAETLSSLHIEFGKIMHYDSLEPINDLFNKMMGILKSDNRHWMFTSSSMLYYLLTELSVEMLSEGKSDNSDEEDIVSATVNYIDCHFNEDFTLEDLAELSKVTPEHFCKLFRRRLNMRPFEYVARKRIQEAKLLLETTSVPISEIGEAVGYHDKSYFGYVFKKYEKISPSQFRGVKN